MDVQRAKEIAISPIMENVEYNGARIYIQHVNEENETARIYPIDQPEQEQDVPLRSLIEPSSRTAMEVSQMDCKLPES
ncbi:small acid-soluble spore protein H [Paenibacillus sp. NEAU-GSW1]|nr:small acid-soluble spore protein H [Paenibacillus sp. NEAU-GSW1]